MADDVRIDRLSVRVPGEGAATGERVAQGLTRSLETLAPHLAAGRIERLALRVELAEGSSDEALLSALDRALRRALVE